MDSTSDNTDYKIISGLKNGDNTSFRRLVDLYQFNVFNICLGFVRNELDADDLTQDVFIEVFTKIHAFRGDASISTWLHRIAVNKSLEFIRRQKRKRRFGFLISLFTDDNITDKNLNNNDHPGIQFEKKELAETLLKAVDKLPTHQKIAFTLHKIDGLSYDEISKIMDSSISSIESLIHRAKVNLRKQLSSFYRNI